MKFDWDPRKAGLNRAKHGVSFEEAARVLVNPESIHREDPAHSSEEPRRQAIGPLGEKVLAVCYAPRKESVRIISARCASRQERRWYAQNQKP